MFSQLGLSPTVCAVLARLGYETPTPIQSRAIPLVLSGVDVLARAQTGTGKTAAFGLPLLERLKSRGTSPAPRALVLVPTRELAVQVYRSLASYSGSRLRVAVIYGGVGMGAQMSELRHGTDIIVATPGRLIDHLQRGTANLSAVEVLTLDEADRMLDMGFLPALKRIVAVLPKTRQTLLFSATFPPEVVRLSADFTRAAVRVDVAGEQVVATQVTHQVHHVALDQKRQLLAEILARHGQDQVLVFCKTKRGANRVGKDLQAHGVSAGVIHGDKSQGARNKALDDFKSGRQRVLVATDIAARGLDIARLPLVVNFDLPLVAEDYVHRVGRTGRAGHPGHAISLVSPVDAPLLRDIQKVVDAPIEAIGTPVQEPAGARVAAPAAPHRPQQRGWHGQRRRHGAGPRPAGDGGREASADGRGRRHHARPGRGPGRRPARAQ